MGALQSGWVYKAAPVDGSRYGLGAHLDQCLGGPRLCARAISESALQGGFGLMGLVLLIAGCTGLAVSAAVQSEFVGLQGLYIARQPLASVKARQLDQK